MECVECGVEADDHAEGWRGYRTDRPDTDEPPELAVLPDVRRAGSSVPLDYRSGRCSTSAVRYPWDVPQAWTTDYKEPRVSR